MSTPRLLLGPGPSNPHPRVLAALSRPLLGHLDPAFLALLDDAQARLQALPGVLSVRQEGTATFLVEAELGHDLRDELARFAVRNDWGLLELTLVTMTLEDVFLRLTQHEEGVEAPS